MSRPFTSKEKLVLISAGIVFAYSIFLHFWSKTQPSAGSMVWLVSTKPSVPLLLASDEESYSKLQSNSIYNDTYAISAMLKDDKVFLMPDSSIVVFLRSNGLKTMVKIIEGEFEGRTGWIVSERVKP